MGTFTTNLGLPLPTIGGDKTTWGTQLNTALGILDTRLAGVSTVDVSGNTDVVAAASDAANMGINLIGTLTGNINYVLPNKGGFHIIGSNVTGAYTLTIKTSAPGGTGVILAPNTYGLFFSGGTNVLQVSGGPGIIVGDLTVVGKLAALGGARYIGEIFAMGAPQTLVPPYALLCYGQAVSRTTYAALFGIIGTVWGPGDGSTTFNVPDLRGRALFGVDAMGGSAAGRLTSASLQGSAAGVGVTGGDEHMSAHTHPITDPGHVHPTIDNGHVHNYTDPGHSHSIYDPAHVHAVTDPQHVHSMGAGVGGVRTGSGSTSFSGPGGGSMGIVSATGYASTGISIQGSLTGVVVQPANTGIGIANAATGLLVNGAVTGIGVNTAGVGVALNLPPAAVVNWFIYAGV